MLKFVCIVSLTLNALVAAFLGFAFSSKKAFIAYEDMDTNGLRYTAAVCAASVPEGQAAVFGPVEFTLRPGETAALQFSARINGSQLNAALDPLYDRDIVEVHPSPFGLRIKALKSGEAVLQTLTARGIRDVAVVTVSE